MGILAFIHAKGEIVTKWASATFGVSVIEFAYQDGYTPTVGPQL
ncbi:hypothetical protein TUM4637_14550 [Shewanella hafniensis]|nr:hypothetical protein TUM4637_14550 [Shewanella hafniensis]